MARLIPIILITALAVYVVWADSTSEEPVSALTWIVDAVIVGLALWSWISFLRRKTDE
jgi:hypothetical protein